MNSALRQIIYDRDLGRCARCGGPGSEIHHRRSRRVRDAHTDCPCNLVLLCGWGNHTGCHGHTHGNPVKARAVGLILGTATADLSAVRIETWRGAVTLNCEGGLTVAL